MAASARAWIEAFAAELGIDAPSDEEVDALLTVASEAAHASERSAAPISCWLVARAELAPDDARKVAGALARRLTESTA